jgi:hypothetical protein
MQQMLRALQGRTLGVECANECEACSTVRATWELCGSVHIVELQRVEFLMHVVSCIVAAKYLLLHRACYSHASALPS